MAYKKPRIIKKIDTRPTEPGMARKILARLQVKPLNNHQKALFNRGITHKPSKLQLWLNRNIDRIRLAEKITVTIYIFVAIIFNPYLFLILPAVGAMVYYRERLKYIWWKLKVIIIFRKYYEHRRQLHQQGTLYHHLNHKLPKKFGSVIVWGESKSIQNIKFRKLQKNNQDLRPKEYIKL